MPPRSLRPSPWPASCGACWHAWVGGAVERGIESGEFTACDVDALSTQVLALCDGLGIRLMLDDPRVDLSTARSTIWGAIAPALGIDPAFPDV